ncbi:protein of unknown function [Candidatus Methylomirabilis oxygeniifera]|uniref:Uncharacterized protein n=1 Tax=Methylomirabilis oxygeniifera TaxID=671143 RepID=D5MGH3_METO1|nr:protein of unknown function [Candidatus Methylomirabilis oxyfera]
MWKYLARNDVGVQPDGSATLRNYIIGLSDKPPFMLRHARYERKRSMCSIHIPFTLSLSKGT